ncbi:GNAT family N-acetyltransferase [Paenibacillus tarimensis]
MDYILLRRTPTIDEYVNVCRAVGWNEFINYDAAELSLQRSLFGVVVQYKDETVGMGRVIGDGAVYFYVQDIAVLPDHQNQGLGNRIMEEIAGFLKEHAPEKAFIGLFAAQGKMTFYKKYGFNKHEGMTGMFGVIHEGEIK